VWTSSTGTWHFHNNRVSTCVSSQVLDDLLHKIIQDVYCKLPSLQCFLCVWTSSTCTWRFHYNGFSTCVSKQVLDDLPPKIIQDVYCELSPLQRALYEDFKESQVSLGVIKRSPHTLATNL
jgi:SNF2 family DNA or RNA helicase